MMFVCAECGKRHVTVWPDFWHWKTGEDWYCSELCMRMSSGMKRKGGKNMARKVTLEQKKKAVDIAIGGGNPLPYLKQCGSDRPEQMWWTIKESLKKVDKETYEKLPERVNAKKEEEAPVQEPTITIHAEDLKASMADEGVNGRLIVAAQEKITESVEKLNISESMNWHCFQTTALKSPGTGFRYENDDHYGMMTWRTQSGDEISMTAEDWRSLAAELPQVMQIFGI